MTKTLFQIEKDMLAIDALLEESGGEIRPENEAAYDAWLAELGNDQANKLDSYVGLLKSWEGDAAVAQSVIDQFKAKLATIENKIKNHKRRMQDYLSLTNQPKAKTASGWELAVQKNGGKTPVQMSLTTDPMSVPERFRKVVVTIDADAVRTALESGETLDFATLGERGHHLRIR